MSARVFLSEDGRPSGRQSSLARALAEELPAEVVTQIHPTVPSASSPNAWFRVYAHGDRRFVKVYHRPDRAQSEQRAVALVGRLAPRLLSGGVLRAGDHYSVFEWESLEPLDTGGAEAFATLGGLLARIHNAKPRGADFHSGLPERMGMPSAAYETALQQFTDMVPRAAREWIALLTEPAVVRVMEEADEVTARRETVLLHGDFSPRNIGRRRGKGDVVVYDFERAELGYAEYDFARMWDREARSAHARNELVAGYRAVRAVEQDLHPALLFAARLTSALTTVVGGGRLNNATFAAHGWEKLGRVTAELSGNKTLNLVRRRQ